MQYQKTIHFYNDYAKRNESLLLKWNFEEGFHDMEQARIAVLAVGQDPELFLYVKHHGSLYAVAANMMEQAIVVARDFVWYREPMTERIHRDERNSYTRLPYVIREVNEYQYYQMTMCQDLSGFDMNMSIILGQRVRHVGNAYKDFCVATLGAVMIRVLIPSYQLGAMSQYFQDISSFERIWEFGIKSYNPFNGYKEIATYTIEEYLKESRISKEDMQDYLYIRNKLLELNVSEDTETTNELILPFHYGKKILFALNMLIGDVIEYETEETDAIEIQEENSDSSKMKKMVNTELPNMNQKAEENSENEKRGLKFCRICHVSLPNTSVETICPVCREEELFINVKDYIREKDVTEREVAEHFHISLNKVRGWIKEGRITYKEAPGIKAESYGPVRKCRECGMQLPSSSKDNICQSCLGLLSAMKNGRGSGIMIENPNSDKGESSKRYFH